MMNDSLQSALASADPVASGEDAELHQLVRAMEMEARAASLTESPARIPWWKRRRAMISLGVLGVVALTGAAMVVPLGLWIDDTRVDLDVEIPITYTTDSGIDVTCRYGIYVGDPGSRSDADEKLAAYVKNHDWAGIGQRIYDEAMTNPFVPGPNDNWEVDNQELRDNFSFNNALSLVVWKEVPTDLTRGTRSSGATSDCTGKLR